MLRTVLGQQLTLVDLEDLGVFKNMSNETKQEDPSDFGRRIAALENQLKQRDTSVIPALSDLRRTSRMVVIVVSIVGTLIAIVQVSLLVQQNTYIKTQTRLNHIEAISSLLSGLDPDDAYALETAMAPFAVFGEEAYSVLIEIADPGRSGLPASVARTALVRGAHTHSIEHARDVLSVLFRGLITEFRNECRELFVATLYSDFQDHLPETPCSVRESDSDRDLMSAAAIDISDYINHWADANQLGSLKEESVLRSIISIYALILADHRGKSLNAMVGRVFPKMMYEKNRAWAMGEFDRSVGILCDAWKGTEIIEEFGLSVPLTEGIKAHQIEISDPNFNVNLMNISNFVLNYGVPGLCDPNSAVSVDDVLPRPPDS